MNNLSDLGKVKKITLKMENGAKIVILSPESTGVNFEQVTKDFGEVRLLETTNVEIRCLNIAGWNIVE